MMVIRLNLILPSLPNYSLFQPAFLEIYLSILILAVCVVGIIWVTAKIFRVGILMSGKRVTLPEIMKWIKY